MLSSLLLVFLLGFDLISALSNSDGKWMRCPDNFVVSFDSAFLLTGVTIDHLTSPESSFKIDIIASEGEIDVVTGKYSDDDEDFGFSKVSASHVNFMTNYESFQTQLSFFAYRPSIASQSDELTIVMSNQQAFQSCKIPVEIERYFSSGSREVITIDEDSDFTLPLCPNFESKFESSYVSIRITSKQCALLSLQTKDGGSFPTLTSQSISNGVKYTVSDIFYNELLESDVKCHLKQNLNGLGSVTISVSATSSSVLYSDKATFFVQSINDGPITSAKSNQVSLVSEESLSLSSIWLLTDVDSDDIHCIDHHGWEISISTMHGKLDMQDYLSIPQSIVMVEPVVVDFLTEPTFNRFTFKCSMANIDGLLSPCQLMLDSLRYSVERLETVTQDEITIQVNDKGLCNEHGLLSLSKVLVLLTEDDFYVDLSLSDKNQLPMMVLNEDSINPTPLYNLKLTSYYSSDYWKEKSGIIEISCKFGQFINLTSTYNLTTFISDKKIAINGGLNDISAILTNLSSIIGYLPKSDFSSCSSQQEEISITGDGYIRGVVTIAVNVLGQEEPIRISSTNVSLASPLSSSVALNMFELIDPDEICSSSDYLVTAIISCNIGWIRINYQSFSSYSVSRYLPSKEITITGTFKSINSMMSDSILFEVPEEYKDKLIVDEISLIIDKAEFESTASAFISIDNSMQENWQRNNGIVLDWGHSTIWNHSLNSIVVDEEECFHLPLTIASDEKVSMMDLQIKSTIPGYFFDMQGDQRYGSDHYSKSSLFQFPLPSTSTAPSSIVAVSMTLNSSLLSLGSLISFSIELNYDSLSAASYLTSCPSPSSSASNHDLLLKSQDFMSRSGSSRTEFNSNVSTISNSLKDAVSHVLSVSNELIAVHELTNNCTNETTVCTIAWEVELPYFMPYVSVQRFSAQITGSYVNDYEDRDTIVLSTIINPKCRANQTKYLTLQVSDTRLISAHSSILTHDHLLKEFIQYHCSDCYDVRTFQRESVLIMVSHNSSFDIQFTNVESSPAMASISKRLSSSKHFSSQIYFCPQENFNHFTKKIGTISFEVSNSNIHDVIYQSNLNLIVKPVNDDVKLTVSNKQSQTVPDNLFVFHDDVSDISIGSLASFFDVDAKSLESFQHLEEQTNYLVSITIDKEAFTGPNPTLWLTWKEFEDRQVHVNLMKSSAQQLSVMFDTGKEVNDFLSYTSIVRDLSWSSISYSDMHKRQKDQWRLTLDMENDVLLKEVVVIKVLSETNTLADRSFLSIMSLFNQSTASLSMACNNGTLDSEILVTNGQGLSTYLKDEIQDLHFNCANRTIPAVHLSHPTISKCTSTSLYCIAEVSMEASVLFDSHSVLPLVTVEFSLSLTGWSAKTETRQSSMIDRSLKYFQVQSSGASSSRSYMFNTSAINSIESSIRAISSLLQVSGYADDDIVVSLPLDNEALFSLRRYIPFDSVCATRPILSLSEYPGGENSKISWTSSFEIAKDVVVERYFTISLVPLDHVPMKCQSVAVNISVEAVTQYQTRATWKSFYIESSPIVPALRLSDIAVSGDFSIVGKIGNYKNLIKLKDQRFCIMVKLEIGDVELRNLNFASGEVTTLLNYENDINLVIIANISVLRSIFNGGKIYLTGQSIQKDSIMLRYATGYCPGSVHLSECIISPFSSLEVQLLPQNIQQFMHWKFRNNSISSTNEIAVNIDQQEVLCYDHDQVWSLTDIPLLTYFISSSSISSVRVWTEKNDKSNLQPMLILHELLDDVIIENSSVIAGFEGMCTDGMITDAYTLSGAKDSLSEVLSSAKILIAIPKLYVAEPLVGTVYVKDISLPDNNTLILKLYRNAEAVGFKFFHLTIKSLMFDSQEMLYKAYEDSFFELSLTNLSMNGITEKFERLMTAVVQLNTSHSVIVSKDRMNRSSHHFEARGSLSEVIAAVSELRMIPDANYYGYELITASFDLIYDLTQQKQVSDSLSVNIEILPMYDFPTITTDSKVTMISAKQALGSMFIVSDSDVISPIIMPYPLLVTISASFGEINLVDVVRRRLEGAVSSLGGNGTNLNRFLPVQTFSCSNQDVNSILSSIIYNPRPGYYGDDEITLRVNDQGFLGYSNVTHFEIDSMFRFRSESAEVSLMASKLNTNKGTKLSLKSSQIDKDVDGILGVVCGKMTKCSANVTLIVSNGTVMNDSGSKLQKISLSAARAGILSTIRNFIYHPLPGFVGVDEIEISMHVESRVLKSKMQITVMPISLTPSIYSKSVHIFRDASKKVKFMTNFVIDDDDCQAFKSQFDSSHSCEVTLNISVSGGQLYLNAIASTSIYIEMPESDHTWISMQGDSSELKRLIDMEVIQYIPSLAQTEELHVLMRNHEGVLGDLTVVVESSRSSCATICIDQYLVGNDCLESEVFIDVMEDSEIDLTHHDINLMTLNDMNEVLTLSIVMDNTMIDPIDPIVAHQIGGIISFDNSNGLSILSVSGPAKTIESAMQSINFMLLQDVIGIVEIGYSLTSGSKKCSPSHFIVAIRIQNSQDDVVLERSDIGDDSFPKLTLKDPDDEMTISSISQWSPHLEFDRQLVEVNNGYVLDSRLDFGMPLYVSKLSNLAYSIEKLEGYRGDIQNILNGLKASYPKQCSQKENSLTAIVSRDGSLSIPSTFRFYFLSGCYNEARDWNIDVDDTVERLYSLSSIQLGTTISISRISTDYETANEIFTAIIESSFPDCLVTSLDVLEENLTVEMISAQKWSISFNESIIDLPLVIPIKLRLELRSSNETIAQWLLKSNSVEHTSEFHVSIEEVALTVPCSLKIDDVSPKYLTKHMGLVPELNFVGQQNFELSSLSTKEVSLPINLSVGIGGNNWMFNNDSGYSIPIDGLVLTQKEILDLFQMNVSLTWNVVEGTDSFEISKVDTVFEGVPLSVSVTYMDQCFPFSLSLLGTASEVLAAVNEIFLRPVVPNARANERTWDSFYLKAAISTQFFTSRTIDYHEIIFTMPDYSNLIPIDPSSIKLSEIPNLLSLEAASKFFKPKLDVGALIGSYNNLLVISAVIGENFGKAIIFADFKSDFVSLQSNVSDLILFTSSLPYFEKYINSISVSLPHGMSYSGDEPITQLSLSAEIFCCENRYCDMQKDPELSHHLVIPLFLQYPSFFFENKCPSLLTSSIIDMSIFSPHVNAETKPTTPNPVSDIWNNNIDAVAKLSSSLTSSLEIQSISISYPYVPTFLVQISASDNSINTTSCSSLAQGNFTLVLSMTFDNGTTLTMETDSIQSNAPGSKSSYTQYYDESLASKIQMALDHHAELRHISASATNEVSSLPVHYDHERFHSLEGGNSVWKVKFLTEHDGPAVEIKLSIAENNLYRSCNSSVEAWHVKISSVSVVANKDLYFGLSFDSQSRQTESWLSALTMSKTDLQNVIESLPGITHVSISNNKRMGNSFFNNTFIVTFMGVLPLEKNSCGHFNVPQLRVIEPFDTPTSAIQVTSKTIVEGSGCPKVFKISTLPAIEHNDVFHIIAKVSSDTRGFFRLMFKTSGDATTFSSERLYLDTYAESADEEPSNYPKEGIRMGESMQSVVLMLLRLSNIQFSSVMVDKTISEFTTSSNDHRVEYKWAVTIVDSDLGSYVDAVPFNLDNVPHFVIDQSGMVGSSVRTVIEVEKGYQFLDGNLSINISYFPGHNFKTITLPFKDLGNFCYQEPNCVIGKSKFSAIIAFTHWPYPHLSFNFSSLTARGWGVHDKDARLSINLLENRTWNEMSNYKLHLLENASVSYVTGFSLSNNNTVGISGVLPDLNSVLAAYTLHLHPGFDGGISTIFSSGLNDRSLQAYSECNSKMFINYITMELVWDEVSDLIPNIAVDEDTFKRFQTTRGKPLFHISTIGNPFVPILFKIDCLHCTISYNADMSGNRAFSVLLSSVHDLNRIISQIFYVPSAQYCGSDTMIMSVSVCQNPDCSTYSSSMTKDISVAVNCMNDSPILIIANTAHGLVHDGAEAKYTWESGLVDVDEDVPFLFHNNWKVVDHDDKSMLELYELSINTSVGTLCLSHAAFMKEMENIKIYIINISTELCEHHQSTKSISIRANLEAVNLFLNATTYISKQDWNGVDHVDSTIIDSSLLIHSRRMRLVVHPVEDPATIMLPSCSFPLSVPEDVYGVIGHEEVGFGENDAVWRMCDMPLSIFDPDSTWPPSEQPYKLLLSKTTTYVSGNDETDQPNSINGPEMSRTFEISLRVKYGHLTMGRMRDDLEILNGTGFRDRYVRLRGTMYDINNSLKGLAYIGMENWNSGATSQFSNINDHLRLESIDIEVASCVDEEIGPQFSADRLSDIRTFPQICSSLSTKTQSAFIPITVSPTNDPPVITYHLSIFDEFILTDDALSHKSVRVLPLSCMEDVECSLGSLTFHDVDITNIHFMEEGQDICDVVVFVLEISAINGTVKMKYDSRTMELDPTASVQNQGKFVEGKYIRCKVHASAWSFAEIANSLVYTSDKDFSGTDAITIKLSDQGNYGGHADCSWTEYNNCPMIDVLVIPVEIEPINDGPVINLPIDLLSIFEDVEGPITGIYIYDQENSSTTYDLQISVGKGRIILSNPDSMIYNMNLLVPMSFVSFHAITLHDVNNLLSLVTYLPPSQWNSNDFSKSLDLDIIDLLIEESDHKLLHNRAKLFVQVNSVSDPIQIRIPGGIYSLQPSDSHVTILNSVDSFIVTEDNILSIENVELSDSDVNKYFRHKVKVEISCTPDTGGVRISLKMYEPIFWKGIHVEHPLPFDKLNFNQRLVLVGEDLDTVNKLLSVLEFLPKTNFFGSTAVQITANITEANSFSSFRPFLSDVSSISAFIGIDVLPVEDAPTLTSSRMQGIIVGNEDQSIVLDDFSAGDVDWDMTQDCPYNSTLFTLALSSKLGLLSLSPRIEGSTIVEGSGVMDKHVVLTGTLCSINSAIHPLTYTPSRDWVSSSISAINNIGYDFISVLLLDCQTDRNEIGCDWFDKSCRPQLECLWAELESRVIVQEGENDPPEILIASSLVKTQPCNDSSSLLGKYLSKSHMKDNCGEILTVKTLTVQEDEPYKLNGIAIQDSDVNQKVHGAMKLTLHCSHCKFITDALSKDFCQEADIDGAACFTGTLDILNNILGTTFYVPLPNYFGEDVVSIVIDDLGNSGSGGSKTDVQIIPMVVIGKNDPSVIHQAAMILETLEDNEILLNQIFQVFDADDYENETSLQIAHIQVDHGSVKLSSTDGLGFSTPEIFAETRRLSKFSESIAVNGVYDQDFLNGSSSITDDGSAINKYSGSPPQSWWSQVTLIGSCNNINKALSRMIYRPGLNWNSEQDPSVYKLDKIYLKIADEATMKVEYSPEYFSSTLLMRVHEQNDGPVISIFDYAIYDKSVLTLDRMSLKIDSVQQVYVPEDGSVVIIVNIRDTDSLKYPTMIMTVEVNCQFCSITLADEGTHVKDDTLTGIYFLEGNRSSRRMKFRGPLNVINKVLGSVLYSPEPHYCGNMSSITIIAEDNGLRGGQPQKDSLFVPFYVMCINDPPLVFVSRDIPSVLAGSRFKIQGMGWEETIAAMWMGQDFGLPIQSMIAKKTGFELFRSAVFRPHGKWGDWLSPSNLTTTVPEYASKRHLEMETDWRSRMVRDLSHGFASSSPQGFQEFQKLLYFRAHDELNGYELWRTDGTTAGTERFIDINPGRLGSYPSFLTEFQGQLYFQAKGRDTSWMLSGSYEDECSGFRQSGFDPSIFFAVSETNTWDPRKIYDCPTGYNWVSTMEAYNLFSLNLDLITAGYTYSNFDPTYVSKCGWQGFEWGGVERVQFRFSDSHITGAYKHAGKPESFRPDIDDEGTLSTELFAGIVCFGNSSSVEHSRRVDVTSNYGCISSLDLPGSDLACLSQGGTELWRTDGTQHGTIRVNDFRRGVPSSAPSFLTEFRGSLYFSASIPPFGVELFRTNGDRDADAKLVKDINRGSPSSNPSYLTVCNNSLFFAADDGYFGKEIHKTSGVSDFNGQEGSYEQLHANMIMDINPGFVGSNPIELECSSDGSILFFQATTALHGEELWASDGEKTWMVKDICEGRNGSHPAFLTAYKRWVLFQATDCTSKASHGNELWISDGSERGTRLLFDILEGSLSSNPSYFTSIKDSQSNEYLVFAASNLGDDHESHGEVQLWITDATVKNTRRIFHQTFGADFYLDHDAISANDTRQFSMFEGEIYFPAKHDLLHHVDDDVTARLVSHVYQTIEKVTRNMLSNPYEYGEIHTDRSEYGQLVLILERDTDIMDQQVLTIVETRGMGQVEMSIPLSVKWCQVDSEVPKDRYVIGEKISMLASIPTTNAALSNVFYKSYPTAREPDLIQITVADMVAQCDSVNKDRHLLDESGGICVISGKISEHTTQNITIGVNAANNAPIIIAPDSKLVANNFSQLIISGLSISDPDADISSSVNAMGISVFPAVKLLITVVSQDSDKATGSGRISLNRFEGLVFNEGDGVNDDVINVYGTLDDIQRSITDLKYSCFACAPGTADAIRIIVNDNGYTGLGGPKSTTRDMIVSIS